MLNDILVGGSLEWVRVKHRRYEALEVIGQYLIQLKVGKEDPLILQEKFVVSVGLQDVHALDRFEMIKRQPGSYHAE